MMYRSVLREEMLLPLALFSYSIDSTSSCSDICCFLYVTPQQGVPGDAVPWPEREVSSLPSLFLRRRRHKSRGYRGTQSPGRSARCPRFLFPPLPPQAAQERYLSSYNVCYHIIAFIS